MSVFVDTSAFIAILNVDDADREAAARIWITLIESGEQLLTSNYVVLETTSLLLRRSGPRAVRQFVDELLPIVLIEWVDVNLHSTGLHAMMASGKRGPSFVDCVSFAVMRKLSIKDVFTFDHHFHEQGFLLRTPK